MRAAADALPNDLRQRCRVVERFAGGEGWSWRVAGDWTPDRVLKVLPAGVEPTEAPLLLSLRHPAIPTVREVGRLADGRAFVLRDHVEGTPLALPRDPDAVVAAARELLEVLAFVHRRGVLHLDLKPQNVLRGTDGTLHLLDFGLGARGGERAGGGTPFFAAPELWLGLRPDARTDLFALGALCAMALWPAGKVPLASFVAQFPHCDFFTAGGVTPERFPPPFDTFLPRCVARRPTRRFADAQAALEFLCGGAGRPSLALLAPDPTLLRAGELAACRAAGGPMRLRGGSAAERQALALAWLASVPEAQGVRTDGEALLLMRPGAGPGECVLAPLSHAQLLLHLEQALALRGDAAADAAARLQASGAHDCDAVGSVLQQLAEAGELVAAGMRWSWPAAVHGRLRSTTSQPASVPDATELRQLAARGDRDPALAGYRRAAAADPAREPELRHALVRGLLAGGDPVVALPFCHDAPLLRAQALFDTGQIAAAEHELGRGAAGDPDAAALLRARCQIASGQRARAIAYLRGRPADRDCRLLLAAALEQDGAAAESETILRALLDELPAAQPFARASALTALGHARRQQGDPLQARQCFEAAGRLLHAIAHARHAASAELNVGVIDKDLGRHDQAAEHLRTAMALYAHCGDAAGEAIATANLGIALLARGDAVAARPPLQTGARRLLQLGNRGAGELAMAELARAEALAGDRAAAQATLAALGEPSSARIRAAVTAARAALDRPVPEPAPAAPPVTATMSPEGPSRELFRTFLAVNRQLAQESDLDKAMQRLLDAAVTLTGGRQGYLLVVRDDGMRREFAAGDSAPAAQAFSRSLAQRSMQLQRTLTGADALADRELNEMPSIRNLQVRSAICAPFRSAGGTVGAIYVEHAGRADAFHDGDKQSLEVLADQAAIAVDRMRREEALAQELQHSRRELAVAQRAARREPVRLLGDSGAMAALRQQIDKLAALDLAVLVLGETGTGKELVARALHEQGPRRRGPFVAENCSALPAELMERELFGHVQGAFTGADRDRPGLLELADGGTLFLDEVGDMPAALQAKLLRALQERQIRRVGGSDWIPLTLRLVAATHKDLRAMVQRQEFREDLFFRIAGVELRVPPLRERGADVEQLARHFLAAQSARQGRTFELGPRALAALRTYRWPGNVRELEHVIARASLLNDDGLVDDLMLPATSAAAETAGSDIVAEPPAPAVLTLREAERRAIAAAMHACGGDKTKAARALGISRTALYEKLKRHAQG